MLWLLPTILCKEAAETTTTTTLGMSVIALLVFDVFFLFYCLLTRTEELKARQTYIFLVHGTYFFVALNEVRANTGALPTLLSFAIIAAVYYFLCSIPLAIIIIAVFNTTVLFNEMNAIFIRQVLGNTASYLLGGSVGLIIAVVLGFFYYDLLLKIHNIFVTYIYTAMLVTLLGLVDLVWSGQSTTFLAVDVLSGIVLFAVIAIIVFMRH